VRDWYVESFKELRTFPHIRDANDELKFTELLRHIYRRHANVVPVMAKVGLANGIGYEICRLVVVCWSCLDAGAPCACLASCHRMFLACILVRPPSRGVCVCVS
jgi:hypothetical protein